ncbi:hypothetical protein ACWE42_16685 [Sutcliffiella cohnii]
MTYTISKLQALDFLLKRITTERDYPFLFNKNFKLVVEVNNNYWYGDFVRMESNLPFQYHIDNMGDVEKVRFSPTGSNSTPAFSKIWTTFFKATKGNDNYQFFSNPFKEIDDLSLLFEALISVLNSADIQDEDSSVTPYLYNANSLDGKYSMQFMNIANEKIKLVSIIEITN